VRQGRPWHPLGIVSGLSGIRVSTSTPGLGRFIVADFGDSWILSRTQLPRRNGLNQAKPGLDEQIKSVRSLGITSVSMDAGRRSSKAMATVVTFGHSQVHVLVRIDPAAFSAVYEDPEGSLAVHPAMVSPVQLKRPQPLRFAGSLLRGHA